MPTHTDWQPHAGSLLLVDLDPTRGTEQQGVRPALVVSDPDMNLLTRRVVICPITRNPTAWPTEVFLPPGLNVQGGLLVDQVRSIDRDARIIRTLGVVPRRCPRRGAREAQDASRIAGPLSRLPNQATRDD